MRIVYEETKVAYKEGDKVRCVVDVDSGTYKTKGKMGIIRGSQFSTILRKILYAMEFQEKSSEYHKCNGLTPKGGLWVEGWEVEKLTVVGGDLDEEINEDW